MGFTSAKSIALSILLVANLSFGQTKKEKHAAILEPVVEGQLISDHNILINPNGDTTSFSQLKGSWLLLDYWSSSCLPCIVEMPNVIAMDKELANDHFKVIMINLDKEEKKWKRGISAFSPPDPNFRTDRMVTNAFFAINLVELKDTYGKSSLSTLMPQYVLIDPQGIIVDKNMPKPSDPRFKSTLQKHMNSLTEKLNKNEKP